MPGLYELLSSDRLECGVDISSKKRALQTLAELLASADPELKSRRIFDHFCERERLGSTGLGNGFAIPHCRMAGIDRPYAAMITSEKAIDFDAADGKPVDLLLGLMVPSEATDTHLQLLADVAKRFGEKSLCDALRTAQQPQELLDLLRPTAPLVE